MICQINFELRGLDVFASVYSCGLFFEETKTKRSKYYTSQFGGLKGHAQKPVFLVEAFPESQIVKVRGNLHYYFNQGKHNANDFHFQDVCVCIDEICAILHVSPNQAFLRCLEFGVNITPAFPLKRLLGGLLCFKSSIAKKDDDSLIESYIFKFNQYYLKLYDKGAIANIGKSNILRFENHISKMQWIQNRIPTLQTLADLQSMEHFQLLQKILLELASEVLIIEELTTLNMTQTEQTKWQHLIEKRNWIGLNPEQRRAKKQSFENITKKFATSTYKEDLLKLIIAKTNQLLSPSSIKFVCEKSISHDKIHHDFTKWEHTNKPIKLPSGKTSNSIIKLHDFTEWESTNKPIKLPLEIKCKKLESIPSKKPNILHGSFIGKTGRFYIQNPIDKNRIAVYDSKECYNQRLPLPDYINRNEAEADFDYFLPIDLNELKTINI